MQQYPHLWIWCSFNYNITASVPEVEMIKQIQNRELKCNCPLSCTLALYSSLLPHCEEVCLPKSLSFFRKCFGHFWDVLYRVNVSDTQLQIEWCQEPAKSPGLAHQCIPQTALPLSFFFPLVIEALVKVEFSCSLWFLRMILNGIS